MNHGNSTTASRIWGVLGTIVFHAIVLGMLVLMVLDYNVRRREMLSELELNRVEEQEDSVDMLLPGEYVMVGDDFIRMSPRRRRPPLPQPPMMPQLHLTVCSPLPQPRI